MRTYNLSVESGRVCEGDSFSKLPCRRLDLVTSFREPLRQRSEKRNVRRVCEIDPETHQF